MTATDRTPIILALLADLVHKHINAGSDPIDADLLHLSDGLALAVDHGAVAALWPPTEVDTSDAEFVKDMILDDVTFGAKNERPMLVSVARRLADVAASLLVRGDSYRCEAIALWVAASKLLDLDVEAPEQVDRERLQVHADLAATMSQRDPQMTYVATERGVVVESNQTVWTINDLRADLASMTEQLAEAIRQRDEARRERDAAHGDVRRAPSIDKTPAAVDDDGGDPTSIRNIAIAAGARDCTVFMSAKSITVAVELKPIGATFFEVAPAVLNSVPLDDPRTYIVRSVGEPTMNPRRLGDGVIINESRREMSETPEDRQARRLRGKSRDHLEIDRDGLVTDRRNI